MAAHSLQELFARYEKALSALDVQAQADLFADAFLSAGPQGTIAHSKTEFLSLADKMAGYYKGIGQEYAKIISVHETRVSDEYELVKVHWGAKFKNMPNQLVEFDVSYLVQHLGDNYEIILSISHEDEQKALTALENTK